MAKLQVEVAQSNNTCMHEELLISGSAQRTLLLVQQDYCGFSKNWSHLRLRWGYHHSAKEWWWKGVSSVCSTVTKWIKSRNRYSMLTMSGRESSLPGCLKWEGKWIRWWRGSTMGADPHRNMKEGKGEEATDDCKLACANGRHRGRRAKSQCQKGPEDWGILWSTCLRVWGRWG